MKLIVAKSLDLRTIVSTIGLFVAIVTAISIPAGYLFVEYSAAVNKPAVQSAFEGQPAREIYLHPQYTLAVPKRASDGIDRIAGS